MMLYSRSISKLNLDQDCTLLDSRSGPYCILDQYPPYGTVFYIRTLLYSSIGPYCILDQYPPCGTVF